MNAAAVVIRVDTTDLNVVVIVVDAAAIRVTSSGAVFVASRAAAGASRTYRAFGFSVATVASAPISEAVVVDVQVARPASTAATTSTTQRQRRIAYETAGKRTQCNYAVQFPQCFL